MKDDRKPQVELSEELVHIVIALHIHFSDENKVFHWLRTKNLNFGNMSPVDLINRGRANRVHQFIVEAWEQNGDL